MQPHTTRRVTLAFFAGLLTPMLLAGTVGSELLTDSMRRTIEQQFPNAKITEVTEERILVLFKEVTVKSQGKEYDLTMSNEGEILLIKESIDPRTLPATALRGIRSVEGKERIMESEQIRVLAEMRAVPLAQPQMQYNAKFNKSGRELEVYVTENGDVAKILKKLKYEE